MKLKPNTDLTKYGFKQWANGVWYLPCELLESQATVSDLSVIVEDGNIRLYHNVEVDDDEDGFQSFDSVFDLPKELVRMIKDGVVYE